jgi:hypothetical protein
MPFSPSFPVSTIFSQRLESVPVNDHIRLEHRLNCTLAKNKILLEREKSWIQLKNHRDMEISKSKSIEEKAYEFEVKLSESLAIVLCSNNI